MARISRCDALDEQTRLRLIGRIGEGASWETLATEFDIAEATIRQWAGRHGYQRSPTAAKRKAVEDMLAKPEVTQTTQTTQTTETTTQFTAPVVSTGNAEVDAAASEDVRDMRLGLYAARLALKVSAIGLKQMSEVGRPDGRATKIWSECEALNVTTIRRIRGLDDATATASITIANPRSFD